MKLEVSPLIAEDPRRCFERYIRRLSERLTCASESSWERLQARAAEQIAGGHVGKLDFFWIHRPNLTGDKTSPDTATGLVCFQFVQGFASNFARVLHLSVVAPDPPNNSAVEAASWRDDLPSAIFEVRRLLFSTLPIDSIRAVVMAAEDESNKIYVDEDIEVAYQQCRFRWFQLTQSLRRTRSSIPGRKRVNKSTRFLVLHSSRLETDPAAPRSNIVSRPALLLRDDGGEPRAAEGKGTQPQQTGEKEEPIIESFSAW